MNTSPKMSDEEIHRHMDFEKLLTAHKQALASRQNIRMRTIVGIGVFMVIITATWLVVNMDDGNETSVLAGDTTSQIQSHVAEQQADSVVVRDQRKQNDDLLLPGPPAKQTPQTSNAKNDPEKKSVIKKDTANERPPAKEVVPVYTQAQPVNGYDHLYAYFSRELTYPVQMIPDSVEGVVSIAFTINVSGRPEKITVEQSLGTAFDEEAIRLVEQMPDWKPATYGNNPMASRLSIPITFQIRKVK